MNRGDIHWVTFPSPDGRRPGVVLTRQSGLGFLTSVTMAPITTTLRPIRTWVQLEASDGIPQRSCINLDSIQTVRIERVGAYITGLPTARMEEVGRAIAFALGLDT